MDTTKKEKVIPPIREVTDDWDKMKKIIQDNWKNNLYLPILEIFNAPDDTLKNSSDDLIQAIMSGRIQFSRGQFSGRFNAAVSRELRKIGAVWDRKQGAFKVPYGNLSIEIKNAISLSESRFIHTMKKLDQMINKLNSEEITEKVKLTDLFNTRIYETEKDIRKSLKGITVSPELTKEQREKVAAAYTENIKIFIKDWTEKEIVKLRKTVIKSTLAGNRYETLISEIKKRYEVSERKARFLARQETSILMSEFKKVRYQDAGSNEYIWTCVAGSANHPVRPMHKKLNGTRQSWKKPPIVNNKGDRKNPGMDYGCRCTVKPIVKF